MEHVFYIHNNIAMNNMSFKHIQSVLSIENTMVQLSWFLVYFFKNLKYFYSYTLKAFYKSETCFLVKMYHPHYAILVN